MSNSIKSNSIQSTPIHSQFICNSIDSGIDGDESSVAKVEPVALDAADAHAIEEVNLAYENVKDVDVLDTAKEGTDLWEAAVKRYEERIDR